MSVQLPASSKLAIGLRWMGRCNLVPGLSERMALDTVRWWVDVIRFSAMRSPHDLSRSGIAISRDESGWVCANSLSVVMSEKSVREGVGAVTRTE